MANKWATIYWQLDDAPQQLRRTIAMPEETVGTLMQRALEEASMMGFISEEEAFSKDALINFQAYLQHNGQERMLEHDGRLDDQLPRQGGRLLFRPALDAHLRAAPLRLSLEGIKPLAAPAKRGGTPLVTWLLILVMLCLLGVVGAILYKRLTKPKPDAAGNTPIRRAAVGVDAGAAAADAGTAKAIGAADAGAAPDGRIADGAAPDGTTADTSPADAKAPDLAPRKPKKVIPKRRRRRRRRRKRTKKRTKKRTRKRSKKRRKRSKRRKKRSKKRSKRSKKRSKRSKRSKKRRKKRTRKPPPRRDP